MTELGYPAKCTYCGEVKPIVVITRHEGQEEWVFCSDKHWRAYLVKFNLADLGEV